MKRPFLPVHKVIVASIVGISFASMLVAEPTLADPNHPFNSLDTDHSSNPLSNDPSDFNMLNIMRQLTAGSTEFNFEQQNQQLDQAAAAFKAAQDQRLQSQQQQNPGASTITSSPNTLPLHILPSSSK